MLANVTLGFDVKEINHANFCFSVKWNTFLDFVIIGQLAVGFPGCALGIMSFPSPCSLALFTSWENQFVIDRSAERRVCFHTVVVLLFSR